MPTRTLRARKKVDYSLKVKKSDMYNYVSKKEFYKGKKRKDGPEDLATQKSTSKRSKAVDKENDVAVAQAPPARRGAAKRKPTAPKRNVLAGKPEGERSVKKPKRRKNAYMHFLAHRREATKARLMAAAGPDGKVGVVDVTKAVSAEWRAMSPAEKEPFERMSRGESVSVPSMPAVAPAKKAAKKKSKSRAVAPARRMPAAVVPVAVSEPEGSTAAYDRLWREHCALRNEHKKLQRSMLASADQTIAADFVEELERKVEELTCRLNDRRESADKIRAKASRAIEGADAKASKFRQREREMLDIIDAYKMITATRVQSRGGGVFRCRSVNPDASYMLDYELRVAGNQVEYAPMTQDTEDLPDMLQEDIVFEPSQTPKFMQLLLKAIQ